jgi:hypothetical protein
MRTGAVPGQGLTPFISPRGMSGGHDRPRSYRWKDRPAKTMRGMPEMMPPGALEAM